MLYIVSYNKKTNVLTSSYKEKPFFIYNITDVCNCLETAGVKFYVNSYGDSMYSIKYLGWYD